MTTPRTTPVFKMLFGTAVVVLGLALTTGQMAAAAGDVNGGVAGNDNLAPKIRQPQIIETALNADESPAIFTRAADARDKLGFPKGPRRAGRHVHDASRGLDFDEVSDADSAGNEVSLTQFDAKGRLVAAVRFDSPAGTVTKANSDAALKAAQHGLTVSGISIAGQAETDPNQIGGGWDVHWGRVQAGVKVRGDEVRVHVRQDGQIQSLAQVQHELTSAPAHPLGQAEAKQAVTRQFDTWFARKDSGYAVQGMDIQWVGPNAAFDESKLGAAPAPYRLAWVANVKPTGVAAESLSLITVYVDAADGAIIGGDVVE